MSVLTGRRLVATALASGALIAAAALPASAHDSAQQAPRPDVVLGHIQYNSPGPDTGSNRSLNGEWVEVVNTSRHSVNLRGWTLSDRHGKHYRFDLRLAGRSSVRVHTGIGRDTRRDVYQDRHNYVWDNSDSAVLRNNHGRVIDIDSWGRGRH